MPKPTKRALIRKPQAIVLMTWSKEASPQTKPGDWDFEWFETDKGRGDYFAAVCQWNSDDVKDHGDLLFLTAEVLDTESMKLGRVAVHPNDDDGLKAVLKAVKDDPENLIAPSPQRSESTAAKPKANAVKAKKPSKAANAAKKGAKGEGAPEVKSKKVRKPIKVEPTTDDTDQAAPEPKAAALKKRLAEKNAGKQAFLAMIR